MECPKNAKMLKKQHCEYRYTGDGLHPRDPYISKRTPTIQKIESLFQDNKVILVRGPPFSGKTSLATLYMDYLKHEALIEHYFCSFRTFDAKTISSMGYLQKECQQTFDHMASCEEPTRLILDDVQVLYALGVGDQFW